MSTSFQCDDKETLVAFLYDEIEPDERRQVAAHVRTCVTCAREIDALRSVRHELAEWQPPEAVLDFQIVPKSATVLRPSRWAWSAMPAWAQAAAAMLVVAIGAGIANVQVRYGNDGVTITTGWMPHERPAVVASAPQPADDWRPALTALETDLRRELQLVRSTQQPETPVRTAGPQTVDANALLRRVQALVNDSEERQRQELALRMTQFGRDIQSDLVRMNQGFRQLQGRTIVVEGNQREMLNLVRRVSQPAQ